MHVDGDLPDCVGGGQRTSVCLFGCDAGEDFAQRIAMPGVARECFVELVGDAGAFGSHFLRIQAG